MSIPTWRDRAWRTVAEVDAKVPKDAPRAEFERALREAYPFGERAYWPYKVWLDCQRAAIRRRFPDAKLGSVPASKRRKPANPGQMEITE